MLSIIETAFTQLENLQDKQTKISGCTFKTTREERNGGKTAARIIALMY